MNILQNKLLLHFHLYIHLIYGGQEKDTDRRVVISTWQSLHNQSEEFFSQFESVIGDESHLFKAKSLVKIMTKLKTCEYRIGTTGTLDGTQVHKLVLEGLFGPVHQVTSTKELIDREVLADLTIDCLILKYPELEVNEIKRAKYPQEIEWLILNKNRNELRTLTQNNFNRYFTQDPNSNYNGT